MRNTMQTSRLALTRCDQESVFQQLQAPDVQGVGRGRVDVVVHIFRTKTPKSYKLLCGFGDCEEVTEGFTCSHLRVTTEATDRTRYRFVASALGLTHWPFERAGFRSRKVCQASASRSAAERQSMEAQLEASPDLLQISTRIRGIPKDSPPKKDRFFWAWFLVGFHDVPCFAGGHPPTANHGFKKSPIGRLSSWTFM